MGSLAPLIFLPHSLRIRVPTGFDRVGSKFSEGTVTSRCTISKIYCSRIRKLRLSAARLALKQLASSVAEQNLLPCLPEISPLHRWHEEKLRDSSSRSKNSAQKRPHPPQTRRIGTDLLSTFFHSGIASNSSAPMSSHRLSRNDLVIRNPLSSAVSTM